MSMPPYVKNAAAWVGRTVLLAGTGALVSALVAARVPAFMPLEWLLLTAIGAVGGALGGAMAAYDSACRAGRASLPLCAARGASWAGMMSFAFAVVLLDPPLLRGWNVAFLVVMGFVYGAVHGSFGRAWYAFGQAVLQMRRGDREGGG